ncbi:hypothetical protein ABIA26_004759 [Sinorhizobium fredii]
MFKQLKKITRALHIPTVEEREIAYLNGSVDRIDLEYRQRQIDRGLFPQGPLIRRCRARSWIRSGLGVPAGQCGKAASSYALAEWLEFRSAPFAAQPCA